MNTNFLSSTVPSSFKERSRAVRIKWYGLNLNAGADSGYITAGRNFRVTSDGAVRAFGEASEVGWKHLSDCGIDGVSVKPLAFCGIDGVLFAVFEHSGKVYVSRLEPSLGGLKILEYEESALTAKIGGKSDFKRHLAHYSVWCGGSDVISGEYSPRLLVYPDKARLDFGGGWGTKAEDIVGYDIYKKTEVTVSVKKEIYNYGWSIGADGEVAVSGAPDGTSEDISKTEDSVLYGYADEAELIPDGYISESEPSISYSVNSGKGADGAEIEYLVRRTENVMTKVSFSAKKSSDVLPDVDMAAVWGNRLFGIDGSKIFASSAGSYLDFSLDTALDSDGANAWYGTSRTGGDFTGICVYGGRIVAFKEGGLYELYGDENPFRLKQISSKGTFSPDTVCEADSVLYYACRDGIYAYSGSYPKNISEAVIPLSAFADGYLSEGVGGTDGVRYFIRVPLAEEKNNGGAVGVGDMESVAAGGGYAESVAVGGAVVAGALGGDDGMSYGAGYDESDGEADGVSYVDSDGEVICADNGDVYAVGYSAENSGGAVGTDGVSCADGYGGDNGVIDGAGYNDGNCVVGGYGVIGGDVGTDGDCCENGGSAVGDADGTDDVSYASVCGDTDGGTDCVDKPVLVYDASTGFWSIISFTENGEEPSFFASDGRHMYCMTESGRIYSVGTEISEGFAWYFEASLETGGTAEIKDFQKLEIAVNFRTVGEVCVSAEFDGGELCALGTFSGERGIRSFCRRLRNCAHSVRKIRFDCVGDVEILCAEFTVTEGGEPNG